MKIRWKDDCMITIKHSTISRPSQLVTKGGEIDEVEIVGYDTILKNGKAVEDNSKPLLQFGDGTRVLNVTADMYDVLPD